MAHRINVMAGLRMVARFTVVLLAVLMFELAHAQEPARSDSRAAANFSRRAGDAIYQVFPYDKSAFYLTIPNSPNEGFAFNGKSPDDFLMMRCRQSARFLVVTLGNEVAGLAIGECDEERVRLEEVVKDAPTAIRRTIDALAQAGPRASDEELRKYGLFYEKRQLADDAEQHYFPVLAGGHGLLALSSIVVIAKRNAWVIQAQITTLCSQYENHRLCTDTIQILSQIAANLRASASVAKPSADM